MLSVKLFRVKLRFSQLLIFFVMIIRVELKVVAYCSNDEDCRPIAECPYENDLVERKMFHLLNYCGVYSGDTHHCCKKIQPPIESTVETSKQRKNPGSPLKHKNANLINRNDCGLLHNGHERHLNKASLRDFPWLALLKYRSSNGLTESFRCGGSLINSKYVLTAASCQSSQKIKLVSVRLGEYRISNETDCQKVRGEVLCNPPSEDIPIESFYQHQNFDPETKLNDIALIRLASTVDLAKIHIAPVCLPLESFQQLEFEEAEDSGAEADSQFLAFAGWGNSKSESPNDILKKVFVDSESNESCKKKFHSKINLNETQMCAVGEATGDVCTGDIGSPLLGQSSLKKEEKLRQPREFQYGIISIVMSCNSDDNSPAVFTRVSSYMNWILDHISP